MTNELDKLAEAAAEVLGEPPRSYVRVGDWLFGGMLLAIFFQNALHLNAFWIVLAAFAFGWGANEWQKKRT